MECESSESSYCLVESERINSSAVASDSAATTFFPRFPKASEVRDSLGLWWPIFPEVLRLLEGEGGQLLLAKAFETPRAQSSEVIRALEFFVDGSAKLSAEWPPRDEEGAAPCCAGRGSRATFRETGSGRLKNRNC